MRKHILIVALCLSLSAGSAQASFIWGATEWTQIANNMQLMLSYIEQVQQTIQQINMYQAMLKNLEKLNGTELLNSTARDLWRTKNMTQSLDNLEFAIIGGQRVAFIQSSVEAQFKQLYPGYANSQAEKKTDYQAAYANWSDNTHEAVKQSLQLSGVQAENFRNETDLANELNKASQSAEGQLQAIQAGNQIAVAMLVQLQQLRLIETQQLKAQQTFLAGQMSEKDRSQEGEDAVFGQLKKHLSDK